MEISNVRYIRPNRLLQPPFPVFNSGTGYIKWVLADTIYGTRGNPDANIYTYRNEIELPIQGEPINEPLPKTRVVRGDQVGALVEECLRSFAELGESLTFINSDLSWELNPWQSPENFIPTVTKLAEGFQVEVYGIAGIDSIRCFYNLPLLSNAVRRYGLFQGKKRRGGLWIPAKRTRSNAVAFTRIRVPHL